MYSIYKKNILQTTIIYICINIMALFVLMCICTDRMHHPSIPAPRIPSYHRTPALQDPRIPSYHRTPTILILTPHIQMRHRSGMSWIYTPNLLIDIY